MPDETPGPVIQLHALSREYGSGAGKVHALSDVSLTVDASSSLGVVGESGSGKSTLGRMMVGLDRPSRGTVTVDGIPLSAVLRDRGKRLAFRRAVQYVAQDTSGSFEPGKRCIDSLSFPAQILLGDSAARARERVHAFTDAFGLDPVLLSRYPAEQSGGQRQRLALIRGLVCRPRLLICDEVVSALDVSIQARVLNTLKELTETGLGIVFITHGLPAASFLTNRFAVMHRGEIVELRDTVDVIERPEHPYTRDLIGAFRAIAGEA